MKPYDKAPLHKIRQQAETALLGLRDDEQARNSYKSYPVTTLSAACATLEKWLNNYPLSKGASYQKTLQDIRAQLQPKHPGYGRPAAHTLSATDYKKALTKFRDLVKKVDTENRNVFIVHGRDHDTRNEVQRVLHSLSIPTIVLEKEDDAGQTVIQKFEREAARCEYAIITRRLTTKAACVRKPARQPPPMARVPAPAKMLFSNSATSSVVSAATKSLCSTPATSSSSVTWPASFTSPATSTGSKNSSASCAMLASSSANPPPTVYSNASGTVAGHSAFSIQS